MCPAPRTRFPRLLRLLRTRSLSIRLLQTPPNCALSHGGGLPFLSHVYGRWLSPPSQHQYIVTTYNKQHWPVLHNTLTIPILYTTNSHYYLDPELKRVIVTITYIQSLNGLLVFLLVGDVLWWSFKASRHLLVWNLFLFSMGSCTDGTSIILLWFLCPSRDPVYGFIVGDTRASEALARETSNYLTSNNPRTVHTDLLPSYTCTSCTVHFFFCTRVCAL